MFNEWVPCARYYARAGDAVGNERVLSLPTENFCSLSGRAVNTNRVYQVVSQGWPVREARSCELQ